MSRPTRARVPKCLGPKRVKIERADVKGRGPARSPKMVKTGRAKPDLYIKKEQLLFGSPRYQKLFSHSKVVSIVPFFATATLTQSAGEIFNHNSLLASLMLLVGFAVQTGFRLVSDGSSGGRRWSADRRIEWAEEKLEKLLYTKAESKLSFFDFGEQAEIKERAAAMERDFARSPGEPSDLLELLFNVPSSYAPRTFRKILDMYVEANREKGVNPVMVSQRLNDIYKFINRSKGWAFYELMEMSHYVRSALIVSLKKIAEQRHNKSGAPEEAVLEKWSAASRKLQSYLDTIKNLTD